MTKQNFDIAPFPQLIYLLYLIKWLLLSLVIGALVGSLTAIFLASLNWVTDWRESHIWIIELLPLGGFVIGLTYHYLGDSVVKGNNLLLEEFHSPKKIIPFRMAPLVLFGTLATHLFGGSAGREGTAVQMGGAVADQFTKFLGLHNTDRRIILIMGISAGFAAVFGTPLAGAVFALEVLILGKIRYEAILPSFLVAAVANLTCEYWGIVHTKYTVPVVPIVTLQNILWALAAGIIFGLTALAFSRSMHFVGRVFNSKISYPPLRPVIGGVIVVLSVWALGTTRFIGLGIPTIVEAFNSQMPGCDFVIKLLLTAITLGAGFKGGEVTPLFFIGATLGSAICFFVPLPVALLAGMGFVAVFSGATNTPIACTLMGIELFGAHCGLYIGIACVAAYLFSGHTGIYASQMIGSNKKLIYARLKAAVDDLSKNKSGHI